MAIRSSNITLFIGAALSVTLLSSCFTGSSREQDSLTSSLKTGRFSVTSARAESDLQNIMAKGCQGFSLTSAQITEYFRLAEPVAERDLHDDPELLVAPCAMTGVLSVAEQRYQFSITASGVARVWGAEQSLALACRTHCDALLRLP